MSQLSLFPSRVARKQAVPRYVAGGDGGTRYARNRARRIVKRHQLTVTDLFCGAGGATSGMQQARFWGFSMCRVLQAVDHDPTAIASHFANHPETYHYIEDITKLDALRLCRTAILWASLECTNFSNAKGGLPRDADSRSLPEHMPRYIRAIRPLYFIVENVAEFMAWGPLDANGKPVSRRKGIDYVRWVESICALGYKYEYRIMNSADFGADTSRKRYFAVFARLDAPIRWPMPTHSKGGKVPGTQPWRPVRPLLDLQDKGASIFNRKKPLTEKTLQRLYAGLCKFVAEQDQAFITKYLSNPPSGKPNPGMGLDNPAPTITTQDRLAVVQVDWLTNPAWFGHNMATTEPAATIVARQDKAPLSVVQVDFLMQGERPDSSQPHFITKYYGSGTNVCSVNEPLGTITTKDRLSLATVTWLSKAFSGDPRTMNVSIDGPAGSITCVDHHQCVSVAFLDKAYGSGPANVQDVDRPAGAILGTDKHSLVQTSPWLLDNKFGNVGRSVAAPGPTLLTGDHHYVVQPMLMPTSYDRGMMGTDGPCPTLMASRRHHYVVQVTIAHEPDNWRERPDDTPTMILIRRFCRAFNIADVYMRLLKVNELLRIQGFPADYQLAGNQTEQKKFVGNSVVPLMAKLITEALYEALFEEKLLHLLAEFNILPAPPHVPVQ